MLDSSHAMADNYGMNIPGRVHNGVVVLEEGIRLPEGTHVDVSVPPTFSCQPDIECQPGELPLVRSSTPGALELTNDRIHEVLEADDIAAVKEQWNVPS